MALDANINWDNINLSRGARWTPEEEAFVVITAMQGKSNDYICRQMPGIPRRSYNAIAGHLSCMRADGRLPVNWRARSWENEPPYTIEEDAEILFWHVWGRRAIDASVFVPHNRAGGSVLARAAYLVRDEDLVETVTIMEQRLRHVIDYHGLLDVDLSDPERDPAIAYRRTAIRLRTNDGGYDYGLEQVHEAIRQSLLMDAD